MNSTKNKKVSLQVNNNMDQIQVAKPVIDDLFEWEVETSYPTKTGNTFFLDVTGQGRKPTGPNIDRIAPRLESLHLVGVFAPGIQTRPRDITGRKNLMEEASGERPEFFYEEFFGEEADVMTTPLYLEGMEGATEEIGGLEESLQAHPEFEHSNTRFGTGFDNLYIKSDDIAEALRQVDDDIGFQVLFSYKGDREASTEYQEYIDSISIAPETSEGVTCVYCAGRYEDPVVYTAGPTELDVEMASVPELEDVEVEHISEMI